MSDLSRDELTKVRSILKREPTETEAGIFTVMWSEHCSYKSSRLHLKKLPTESDRTDHTFHLRSLASQYGDGIYADLAAQEIMRLLREESDLTGDGFEALTRVVLGAFAS